MRGVSGARLRSAGLYVGVLVLFVSATVAVRGLAIADWTRINPDEAELMAQARAAQHSILPFTTWTMGTTGPWWPMFLALLGALGYPLTLAAAHVLAATLLGTMGFLAWVLMRRHWGTRRGLLFAVLWWLPIALIFPLGSQTDFGALSTELLPSVLVLAAALMPSHRLVARPVLFVIPGLLSGLAVGAKYQVLPLVLALLWVQLREARAPRGRVTKGLAWWAVAAAAPFVLLTIALVAAPSVSMSLVSDNVVFLGSYADTVPFGARLMNSITMFSGQAYLIALVIFLVRLAWLSSRSVALSRAILAVSSLVAVGAGGMGFGHYLWLVYTACVLSASLPVRSDSELIPWPPLRKIVLAATAALVMMVLVRGSDLGLFRLTNATSLAAALEQESTPREGSVAAFCPAGSDVMVWGWAPELYVYYSWHNTVPFMNTLGLRASGKAHDDATPLVERGIAQADCVFDATGVPFFDPDPTGALVLAYPAVAPMLEDRFVAHRDVLDCESCVLYVRD